MRPASRLFVAVLVMSSSIFAIAGSQVEIPGWVQQAAAEPAAAYPPETKAVVLLDETTYSVANASECAETYRRVVRILRPEGRDYGQVAYPVGKDDKLLNFHAWSIDSAGNRFELKQKEFEK